jgi:hypothetical protein
MMNGSRLPSNNSTLTGPLRNQSKNRESTSRRISPKPFIEVITGPESSTAGSARGAVIQVTGGISR